MSISLNLNVYFYQINLSLSVIQKLIGVLDDILKLGFLFFICIG